MPPKSAEQPDQSSNNENPAPTQQMQTSQATPQQDDQPSDPNAQVSRQEDPVPSDQALPADERSSAANRRALANAHIAQGAIHNPAEVPRVDGEWHWLEDADRLRAQNLGYATPIDVTVARANGQVENGLDTPNVLFYPNRAHVNPEEEPDSEGDWNFLTFAGDQSARTLAWLQLGGQADFGFADTPYPTARQVWEARRRRVAEDRDVGMFDGIDIVWSTMEAADDASEPYKEPEEDEEDNSGSIDPDSIDKEVFDEAPPHYCHDPTNGGEHDQTGAPDLHRYRTIKINGKKYTCDVSGAAVNRREPHKCSIPNAKGNWRQYMHAGKIDWKNQEDVKKLNSWRDQVFKRCGWPAKRSQKREDYTAGQKRFIFDFVDKNGGKPPGRAQLKRIAEEFYRTFKQRREVAGMSALCARLSKMHKETGGKFVVGPKRGEVKQQEAELKRKEREEKGEESPRKRRRQSTKKKAEEEEEVDETEVGDGEGGEEDEDGAGEGVSGGEGEDEEDDDDLYGEIMGEKDGGDHGK